nr:uncharacterized protein LOC110365636 isoform X1 [Columba livia]
MLWPQTGQHDVEGLTSWQIPTWWTPQDPLEQIVDHMDCLKRQQKQMLQRAPHTGTGEQKASRNIHWTHSKYFALRRDRLTEKARGDMKSYSKRNAVKLNRDQSHNRQEGEARNGHKTASIKGTLYEKIKQFPQISLDSLCGLHLSFCSEEGFDSAAPLPHGTQHCALHAGPQHLAAHSWTSQGTQGDLADLQPLLTHGTSDISLPMR